MLNLTQNSEKNYIPSLNNKLSNSISSNIQSKNIKKISKIAEETDKTDKTDDLKKLIKIIDINTLVISGGAMKGYLFIGVIKLLFEYNIISKIQKYYGTSFGAIIVSCLILGWNFDELLKLSTKFPVDSILNYDIDNFIENYGLIPKINYETLYKKIIIFKGFDPNITFKQLYDKTGKELNIIVYDIKNSKAIVVNYNTFPDLMIWEGLYMTTALPVLVPPYAYKDNFYIDGGIVENFPIDRIPVEDIYKTIGICTNYHTNDWEKIEYNLLNKDIINYLQYSLELIKIIITRRQLNFSIDTIIFVNFNDNEASGKNIISSIKFNISDIEKKFFIDKGYDQAKKQFKNIIEKIFFNQLKTNKFNTTKTTKTTNTTNRINSFRSHEI
jgi:predicted patatin/cPLA2 family phospholipase